MRDRQRAHHWPVAVCASALEQAQQVLVRCCDGANPLHYDFLLKASQLFTDPPAASVFSRIFQADARCIADHLRSGHTFRVHIAMAIQFCALLSN